MDTVKSFYHRLLIKLSGEAMHVEKSTTVYDQARLTNTAEALRRIHVSGTQLVGWSSAPETSGVGDVRPALP